MSDVMDHHVSVVRDVLIESTDLIPAGSEPFVGWSEVLAERIVKALEGHAAYIDCITGGWDGYQARCADCDWRSTADPEKDVARHDMLRHMEETRV